MPFLNMPGLNGTMFEAYARAGQAIMQTAFAMNQELVRFASERFKAEMEGFQTLTKCKDWKEVSNVQSEFMQTAMATYQAETSKLMEQSMEASTAAWKPLSDSAKGTSEKAD
jgi:hypothetical protein